MIRYRRLPSLCRPNHNATEAVLPVYEAFQAVVNLHPVFILLQEQQKRRASNTTTPTRKEITQQPPITQTTINQICVFHNKIRHMSQNRTQVQTAINEFYTNFSFSLLTLISYFKTANIFIQRYGMIALVKFIAFISYSLNYLRVGLRTVFYYNKRRHIC